MKLDRKEILPPNLLTEIQAVRWKAALIITLTLAFIVIYGGSAFAQNCPAGYTNTGALCTRPADTKPNQGSRVADCPGGYTNNGANCGRGADTIATSSRVADCPTGWKNMGAYCGKGLSTQGMSSMSCKAGEFKSGARCYTECPAGYTNTGVSCFRPVSSLGMDSMICSAGEFKSGARCYKECPFGYTNNGVTCYRGPDTVPRSADINWIAPPAVAAKKFYNIAHMVNTSAAVTWAVKEGANGLEMDLRFDAQGNPSEFRHGGVCDCVCPLPGGTHVCEALKMSCEAKEAAASLLNTVATSGVALLYIDSKVDKNTSAEAGKKLIEFLEKQLFARGYQGLVAVGAPSSDYFSYLEAAANRGATSSYKERIYYGIDQDNGGKAGAAKTIAKLQTLTSKPKITFASGLTSCAPFVAYYAEITEGVRQQAAGVTRLTATWTLDKPESMGNYLDLGVRAILTNRPRVLNEVLKGRGIQLARPGELP